MSDTNLKFSMKRFEKFSSQSSNSNQTMSSTSTTSLHHLDLDSYLFKENGRKLFQKFLKEKSTDNLLTVYLIMSCFENKDYIGRYSLEQSRIYFEPGEKVKLNQINALINKANCNLNYKG